MALLKSSLRDWRSSIVLAVGESRHCSRSTEMSEHPMAANQYAMNLKKKRPLWYLSSALRLVRRAWEGPSGPSCTAARHQRISSTQRNVWSVGTLRTESVWFIGFIAHIDRWEFVRNSRQLFERYSTILNPSSGWTYLAALSWRPKTLSIEPCANEIGGRDIFANIGGARLAAASIGKETFWS